MLTTPLVSIVIPVFDDEEWVSKSLESCINQTIPEIEIICVDDASTDGTCEVIEKYRGADPRIKLVRLPENQSAFQARLAGISNSTAKWIMFLDGDDELAPTAVQEVLEAASTSGADVIGFGVDVVVPEGTSVVRFARDLQPKYSSLVGDEIIEKLFPVGQVAQGHLWRYLWTADLLRRAYDAVPEGLKLYRANDIPIAFLALAQATRYASVPSKLYRYYWRRGVSGQQVMSAEMFDFYLSALDSIDSIADGVKATGETKVDDSGLKDSYRSARRSIIQMILRYCIPIADPALQADSFNKLRRKAGPGEVVHAAATFNKSALTFLSEQTAQLPHPTPKNKNVLIVTGNLGSGGVQGVVVSQAQHLAAAGYNVTVAVRTIDGLVHTMPEHIGLVELEGKNTPEKLETFAAICASLDIGAVIDHYILYHDDWPFFALLAHALNIPTIGWLHNFALRPIFDNNTRSTFLATHLPILYKTVVLSEADVAFWKLRGVENVVYLPNPPSPMLLDLPYRTAPRTLNQGPARLVWWGRLQQHTKRVRELISVAKELKQLDVNFNLTIIGPDSGDLNAGQIKKLAIENDLEDQVHLPGAMHGEELLAALEHADVYVCTSAIEGYPLVLTEAQAVGLPVAMYDLPWLAVAQNNDGIIRSRQEDAKHLAYEIAKLVSDDEAFVQTSAASLRAAHRDLSHDFGELYAALLEGHLPPEYSPAPTMEHAKMLLNLSVQFAEDTGQREKRHASRVEAKRDQYRSDASKHKSRAARYERELTAEREVAANREKRIVELDTQLQWEQRALQTLRARSNGSKDKPFSAKTRAALTRTDSHSIELQNEIRNKVNNIETLLILGQRDTLSAIDFVAKQNKASTKAPEKKTNRSRARVGGRSTEPAVIKAIRPMGKAAITAIPALTPLAKRFNQWALKL